MLNDWLNPSLPAPLCWGLAVVGVLLLVASLTIAVLKRRLAGEAVAQETSGMSKGEWREFVEVWG